MSPTLRAGEVVRFPSTSVYADTLAQGAHRDSAVGLRAVRCELIGSSRFQQ